MVESTTKGVVSRELSVVIFRNFVQACERLTHARNEQKKENHEKKKTRPCRSSGLKMGSDKAFPVTGFTAGDERQNRVGIAQRAVVDVVGEVVVVDVRRRCEESSRVERKVVEREMEDGGRRNDTVKLNSSSQELAKMTDFDKESQFD